MARACTVSLRATAAACPLGHARSRPVAGARSPTRRPAAADLGAVRCRGTRLARAPRPEYAGASASRRAVAALCIGQSARPGVAAVARSRAPLVVRRGECLAAANLYWPARFRRCLALDGGVFLADGGAGRW